MAGGTVDFGPPPKPQGVDFGPPPTHAQAVDFGPPPSKPRPITDIPVLGPRYVGPGATFRPDALAPYKPPVPQSSVRAASSLGAANQIPAPVTPADKLLGGDSGYPLVDLATNELFGRDQSPLSRAANLAPPVFLARQGAQAGQELGRGQYGQGLARLGANAAMGLAGETAGPLLRRAGAEAAPAVAEAAAPAEAAAAAVPVRKTLTQMSPSELVDRAAAAGYPDLSRGTNGVEIPLEERGAIYANTPMSPSEMVEQAVQAGLKDTSRGTRPVAADATAVAPPPEDAGYRFAGPALTPEQKTTIADIGGSALTSPYSRLTREFPKVAEKANQVGAARHYADYLAQRGVGYATEGLTPEQVSQFTNRLVADNLEAVNPESPALDYHRAQYSPGIESEPWFKTALDNYKTYIENPIEPYAQQAGVGEAQMRRPSLGAYVKLLAADPETGAPLTGPGASTPKNLSPRTLKSVSAQQATGLASRYSDDLMAIVQSQREKITKGARNALMQEVSNVGQQLGPKEPAPEGAKVVAFDDNANVVPPIGAKHRYAVAPSVADGVAHVQKQLASGATTPYTQAGLPRLLTGASLEFSPAAAPYHMSSLTAKVGNVPGTGVLDELPNVLPILGKRAQGIARVVGGVDFS